MEVYERRPQTVLDCVSPYVGSIELLNEVPCDVTSGACTWIGRYKVVSYNTGDDPTYKWTISGVGFIPGASDEEGVEVHVTSSFSEILDLTVEVNRITGPSPDDATMTKEIITTICSGPCV